MLTDQINLAGGVVVMTVLFALGYVLIQAATRDASATQVQLKIFIAAVVLRFLLAIFIYQIGFISVLKDEDGLGWARGAILAAGWERSGVGLFQLPFAMAEAYDGHHLGYYYLLGGFFYLTGMVGRMPAAALNCFCGAMTAVFAYRIGWRLFSPWVGSRAGWMTCLFPSMLIWSAQTIKEPVVILLELSAVYCFIRIRQGRMQPRHLVVCALTLAVVGAFRFYVVYLLLAAVLLSFLPTLIAGRAGTPFIIAAVVAPLVIGTGILARQQAIVEKYDLKKIQTMREYGAKTTGSGTETAFNVTTPGGFTAGIAVGAAHLLLAPFPWQMGGSIRVVMTLPEMLYWWWLVFAGLIPGFRYAISKRLVDVMPLLTLVIGFGLLYSLTFYNVGLVYRQRAQLLPYLLIFAGVGLERRALLKLARREAYYRQRLQLTARPGAQ